MCKQIGYFFHPSRNFGKVQQNESIVFKKNLRKKKKLPRPCEKKSSSISASNSLIWCAFKKKVVIFGVSP